MSLPSHRRSISPAFLLDLPCRYSPFGLPDCRTAGLLGVTGVSGWEASSFVSNKYVSHAPAQARSSRSSRSSCRHTQMIMPRSHRDEWCKPAASSRSYFSFRGPRSRLNIRAKWPLISLFACFSRFCSTPVSAYPQTSRSHVRDHRYMPAAAARGRGSLLPPGRPRPNSLDRPVSRPVL